MAVLFARVCAVPPLIGGLHTLHTAAVGRVVRTSASRLPAPPRPAAGRMRCVDQITSADWNPRNPAPGQKMHMNTAGRRRWVRGLGLGSRSGVWQRPVWLRISDLSAASRPIVADLGVSRRIPNLSAESRSGLP